MTRHAPKPRDVPAPNLQSSNRDDFAICVESLSKKYCSHLKRSFLYGMIDGAKDVALLNRKSDTLRKDEFWVLQNISFNVTEGECLGVIGVNGSGKTTLMKLIAGLLRPDGGTITTRGRIAPLIALGAFFTPILSGRENAHLAMMMLGLTDGAARARMDDVIAFAELERVIDDPVQNYSSGMRARLAFSIALKVDADILILDEVLSVGDTAFRNKCRGAIGTFRRQGGTILLVTHNMAQAQNFCDRLVVLDKGHIVHDGDPSVGTQIMFERSATKHLSDQDGGYTIHGTDNRIQITDASVTLAAPAKQPGATGKAVKVTINVECMEPLSGVSAVLRVNDVMREGELLFKLSSESVGQTWNLAKGCHQLSCELSPLNLAPGYYTLDFRLRNQDLQKLGAVNGLALSVDGDASNPANRFHQDISWSRHELN